MSIAVTAEATAGGKEKALWLLEKLVPGTGVNNLGLAVQVEGTLRPDALKAALAIMLGRHEALRTVFRPAGPADLVKWVLPASDLRVDLEPIGSGGVTVEERLVTFTDRPFALDGRPLVRAGVAADADGDVFCLAVHHLAFDMISMALFVREFIGVYEAVRAGRAVPPAAPVTATPEREPRPADLAYWRQTLDGYAPAVLDLRYGTPEQRRPVMPGGIVRHPLSPAARQALAALQRASRAPMAAVLLTAYAILLASHGAGPDIAVGSPVDVRGAHPEAIGYHVNVVPLRIRVDFAAGFRALARQARDAFLGAMAHAELSVDELAREFSGPLFRHLFNFLPAASLGDLSVDGMSARLVTVDNPYSKFDLELVGTPSAGEIWFRYGQAVLTAADVEALLRRFEAVVIAAAEDPDRPVGATAGWSDLDREIVERAHATGRWAEGLDDLAAGHSGASIVALDGRLLPVGVRGELVLAPGHRTGVQASWRPDGTIERTTSRDEAALSTGPVDEELVAVLVGMWRDLLGVEADADTDFFEAGGHSLLAAVLAQRVEDTTGIAIPLPDIFAHPSPIALAARLRA